MRSFVCSMVLVTSLHAAAQVLPPDAEAIVTAYKKKAAAIREKAERETQPHTAQAIAALQALHRANATCCCCVATKMLETPPSACEPAASAVGAGDRSGGIRFGAHRAFARTDAVRPK